MLGLRRLSSFWRPGGLAVAAIVAADATKELCESSYPHKVDVNVPAEGLGRRVDDMVLWCDEHSSGAWDSYDHRSGRRSYVRFYFLDGALAAAFAAEWGGYRRS
jgi:hypothetical protein